MNNAAKNPSQETVMVQSVNVICDGGGGAIGHPQVFLHINHETKDVVCPYCEKRFVLEGN